MPLRKSPALTPAFLSACRANAQKSTGPRTSKGKGRIALNALKHGRYCKSFRESLIKAHADVETYDWILDVIRRCFEPRNTRERLEAEMLGREVWCNFWHARRVAVANRKSGGNSAAAITNEGAQFSAVSLRTSRRLTFKLDRAQRRKIVVRLDPVIKPSTPAGQIPGWHPVASLTSAPKSQHST